MKVDSRRILFFHNIEDGISPKKAEAIMFSAKENLEIYENFIKNTIKAKEAKVLVSSWKLVEEPEIIAEYKREIKENPNALVIKLIDDEKKKPEENEKIHKEFLETDFFIDSSNGKGRRVNVFGRDPDTNTLCIASKPSDSLISLPPNTGNNKRQLDAIYALFNSPRPEYRPLIHLLETKERSESWPEVQGEEIYEDDWYLLRRETPNSELREGTEEQREFVRKALGTKDFAFLEGPAGSGKTTAICEIILQEIKKGHRILLCSQTHVAVDNPLKRIKDRKEVIAVRIGDNIRKIDEEIRDLHIDVRRKKEKADLIKFLERKNKDVVLGSRKYLEESLRSEDGEQVITDLILDSANLVCGTTMGILKHPYISKIRSNPRPIFDVLIIDEASKSTFQEWLVPALYATKWLIIGDCKQLSPFVDDDDITSTISTYFRNPAVDYPVCSNLYRCKYHQAPTLIRNENPDATGQYLVQAEKLALNLCNLDDLPQNPGMDLLLSDVFIGSKSSISKWISYLPNDIRIFCDFTPGREFISRQNFYRKNHKNIKDIRAEKQTPPEEISWRLDRSYQLRKFTDESSPEYRKKQNYERAIDLMLPRWDESAYESLSRILPSLKMFALPSVIELFQEGFFENTHLKESVLSAGFNNEDWNERHVLLQYQHRMDPIIAEFPSDAFYNNEALITPHYLGRKRRDEFPFDLYKCPAFWFDYNDHPQNPEEDKRGYNEREIDIVMEELELFIRKASSQKPPQGEKFWEVAVLTFYLKQESKFRRRLQNRFKTSKNYDFYSEDGNVHIKLCTVDRFQGHEANLVFLSFVKNVGNVGFLDNPNRLNVALTRAKNQLVIVGDRRFFKNPKKSTLLSKLAEYYENKTGYPRPKARRY